MPSRLIVSSGAPAADQPFFTADLFGRFAQNCGCHTPNPVGGFRATLATFSDDITDEVMRRIRSNDSAEYMPPPPSGKPFADRAEGDPIRQLATLLDTWIAQGKPRDLFTLPASLGGMSPFHLGPIVARNLTNIGSCIPDAGLVGTDYDRMCQMDAMFESLARLQPGQGSLAERIGLPERLELTDLNTFDTEALARQGVVAYAPAYPLWSDDAGKFRLVRVPLGQHIGYDAKTHEFEIPDNTRFYKTFLKKVVEADGVERYRKVETRLIVARPPVQHDDGSVEQMALYGTYAWSDDESQATLVTDPLRNAEPFADRVLTLITDEPGAAQVRLEHPGNPSYYLADKHYVRHYAIPGSKRCEQCHMGSASKSFVLGFAPLQVNRRAEGEGGTIAPTGPDELTQLQRLIDYGVIKGMGAVEKAPKLEESQLPRKPRNDYELRAQSYMFGNCGHCHNPHGYPSITNPALAPLLRFWPAADGGIFQFPLDRMSPRIHRGAEQDVELPYITPSLYDLVPTELVASKTYDATPAWRPKGAIGTPIYAPWRSVIYRNVDTPFTYSDDFAIFPHMPMNTSGYDCRAARILAEWMISIPARRDSNLIEDGVPPVPLDNRPQPYHEVKPDESGYRQASGQAEQRLATYQNKGRYSFCTDTNDIQDRSVLEGERVAPTDGEIIDFPEEGVPDHPHWSPLDLSDTVGDWNPRRADWATVIINRDFGPPLDPGLVSSHPEVKLALDAQKEVVDRIRLLSLSKRTAFKQFALTDAPFGLWEEKEGCSFGDAIPKAGSFTGESRPRWMSHLDNLSPRAPVYMTLPGAAIYGMICINCHGEQADSNGRQAATLSDMTGGAARVANFKTGLFGNGVGNIQRVFGEELQKAYRTDKEDPSAAQRPADWVGDWPGEPEDWAARYMPWMALGGTLQRIPAAITNLVSATEVLGVKRNPPLGAENVSANMLAVAQRICLAVLPLPGLTARIRPGVEHGDFDRDQIYAGSGLILKNGDAELWEQVCNSDNPGPVRALAVETGTWSAGSVVLFIDPVRSFYRRTAYPANTPIGDYAHVKDALDDSNQFPWCVIKPTDANELAAAQTHQMDGKPLPFCPDALMVEENRWKQPVEYRLESGDPNDNRDDFRLWAEGGAINAGMAVFLYLEQILAKGRPVTPRYDQCERINAN